MRRLFACAFVALGAVALAPPVAPAQAGEVEMEWSVQSRFGGDANGDGRLDSPVPAVTDLDLVPVLLRPSGATCESEDAKWLLDSRPVSATRVADDGGCQVLVATPEGAHTIEVSAGGRTETAAVEIDDRLIVAIGDSVASGQGNPQRWGPSGWKEPRCHRSALAGFEQAASLLAQSFEQGPPGRSITFVSLACSGAEVDIGLLEPYAGSKPPSGRPDLEPQVDRLATIAGARGPTAEGGSSVDAVLLSVGGNDIGFSRVVAACASPIGNCAKELEADVTASLAKLPGGYDRLDDKVDEATADAPVLITQYFDPTHDERGRFCGHSVGLTSRAEGQWAFEAVLRPLNGAIEAAADRGGWRMVDGIAADFERHGYCVDRDERWVRTLSGSESRQGDPWGTMHPSEPGHAAIARRVIEPLADVLGLTAPPGPASEAESRTVLESVGVVAVAVAAPNIALHFDWMPDPGPLGPWIWHLGFLLFGSMLLGPILLLVGPLLLALWVLARLVLLLRPTRPADPAAPARAEHPGLPDTDQLDTRRVLLLGGAGVALFALATIVTGLAGTVILWFRFWSARLPIGEAFGAVSPPQLVAVGVETLLGFLLLGVLAVGVAWLIDGKGQWVRGTRRGLLAIGLAEVLLAVWLGDFRTEQALQLGVGLTVGALLLYFLVETALAFGPQDGFSEWASKRLNELFSRHVLHLLWQALPFVLLAATIVVALSLDGTERRIWMGITVTLAMLLIVAPGSLAAPGLRLHRPDTTKLRAPRVALSLAFIACLLILIARDEPWLSACAMLATVLGLLCLAAARASGRRFGPYGLAILIAVPLFGTAATVLRGIDSPEMQPVAVLIESGEAVCGGYVGEDDDRVSIARVELDRRADVRRPRDGTIFTVPTERVSAISVAAPEPVAGLQEHALQLRDDLLDERGEDAPDQRAPVCEPPSAGPGTAGRIPPGLEPVAGAAAEAEMLRGLAERYQPELVIDGDDGFWPIPVRTLFAMRDRRAAICHRAAAGGPCLRLETPGRFPWTNGLGDHLEYPAADDDAAAQHDMTVEALGTSDPAESALVYYLASHRGENRPITIQYWFFYSFNYQPTARLLDGGHHEGDFESVAVLLSAKTKVPRYIWMARHNREGRLFSWDDEALEKIGDHPRVFVAKGSHASYESCGRKSRPAGPGGFIDDYPSCNEDEALLLPPETTPLADLSRVGWACWNGLFGHAGGGFSKLIHLVEDAPRSPLSQQKFGGVTSEPCAGIEDPGGREGRGEAVLEEAQAVPATLRRRAGTLVPMVDRCADWHRPALNGTYLVACDPKALRAYLASGLEKVGGAGVRIDMARASSPQIGEFALPAVARNPAASYLDGWRIVAAKPTEVSVFASCPRSGGKRAVAAEFEDVTVLPGRPLQLLDRGFGGVWRLTTPDGAPVSEAEPFPTRMEAGELVRAETVPNQVLACGPDN